MSKKGSGNCVNGIAFAKVDVWQTITFVSDSMSIMFIINVRNGEICIHTFTYNIIFPNTQNFLFTNTHTIMFSRQYRSAKLPDNLSVYSISVGGHNILYTR